MKWADLKPGMELRLKTFDPREGQYRIVAKDGIFTARRLLALRRGDFEDALAGMYEIVTPVEPMMTAVDAAGRLKIASTMADEKPGRLPRDAQARKGVPVATGCVDYFPDALAAVAELSRIGNEQHNPGKPLFWDRSKSGDEADALMRHFLERGTFDVDGVRHSTKVAWRALALLQKELETA